MADSDKTLKLLIELGVVGQNDVEAVNGLLAETKGATADLAKEMGVVTVSGAEADKILGGLGDTQKNVAEHTAEHAERGRDLHRALNAVDRLVPGLGEGLKAAFNPEEIGIVSFLVAVEVLKSVLEDINALNEVNLASFTGSKDAVEAVRDAYEKATVAAQLFVDEQKRLDAAGLTAEDVAKRKIESFKNLATAQEQYNAARKQLATAQIDNEEDKGIISHQQALNLKFTLDVEYARKKLQLEAQTDATALAAKQQQLATEQRQLATAKADQTTDEANAAATDARKAKHDTDIEAQKKNIEDAHKTLEELAKPKGSLVSGQIDEESVEKLEDFYQKIIPQSAQKPDARHSEMFAALQDYLAKNNILHGHISTDDEKAARVFMAHTLGNQAGGVGLAKYDEATSQLQGAQKQLTQLEKSQFQIDLNAERGKKQLEATDEAVRTLSKSVESLAREIPQIQADNAARQNNNAAVENLNLRTERVRAGLPDPGNAFRANTRPRAAADTEHDVNATPWRYDYSTPPPARPGQPSAWAQEEEVQGRQRQAVGDLTTVIDAGNVLHGGGRIDARHTAILEQILTLQTGHEVGANNIYQAIRSVVSSTAARQAALAREIEALGEQVKNSRGRISG